MTAVRRDKTAPAVGAGRVGRPVRGFVVDREAQAGCPTEGQQVVELAVVELPGAHVDLQEIDTLIAEAQHQRRIRPPTGVDALQRHPAPHDRRQRADHARHVGFARREHRISRVAALVGDARQTGIRAIEAARQPRQCDACAAFGAAPRDGGVLVEHLVALPVFQPQPDPRVGQRGGSPHLQRHGVGHAFNAATAVERHAHGGGERRSGPCAGTFDRQR